MTVVWRKITRLIDVHGHGICARISYNKDIVIALRNLKNCRLGVGIFLTRRCDNLVSRRPAGHYQEGERKTKKNCFCYFSHW